MGRGVAILAVFGAVLGAFVAWGPVHIAAKSHVTEPATATDSFGAEARTNGTAATVTPVHKSEGRAVEALRRDAVLAATSAPSAGSGAVPPQPTTALDALPERAIPGFPLTPHTTLSSDQLGAAIKQARSLQAQGQLVEARALLSDVYLGHRMTREQRVRLAEELDPISKEILRSRAILDDGQLYEVEPGDTLVKLAKHFKVPAEFIARINDIANPRQLRRGQTLKFVNGPFDVLIETREFELTVLQRGKYVRRFSIGVGKDDTPTPLGLNTVRDKQVKPIKWPDEFDRRKYSGDDPANPLGSRWISIGAGYGIHGTIEPTTVGQKASRGCIRMTNKDVEELYDMLTEGSRVLIR